MGVPEKLAFTFRPLAGESRDPSLLWGQAALFIGGMPVWASPDGGPIEWTWIDLLETLGRNWGHITLEQTYPFHLTPASPSRLRADAEGRWQDLSALRREEEDETLFRFESRHDLACGLRGLFVPPVFVMREGLSAWISSDDVEIRIQLDELVQGLREVGDVLASVLERVVRDDRAERALNRWRRRDEMDAMERLTLQLGLDAGGFASAIDVEAASLLNGVPSIDSDPAS